MREIILGLSILGNGGLGRNETEYGDFPYRPFYVINRGRWRVIPNPTNENVTPQESDPEQMSAPTSDPSAVTEALGKLTETGIAMFEYFRNGGRPYVTPRVQLNLSIPTSDEIAATVRKEWERVRDKKIAQGNPTKNGAFYFPPDPLAK